MIEACRNVRSWRKAALSVDNEERLVRGAKLANATSLSVGH